MRINIDNLAVHLPGHIICEELTVIHRHESCNNGP